MEMRKSQQDTKDELNEIIKLIEDAPAKDGVTTKKPATQHKKNLTVFISFFVTAAIATYLYMGQEECRIIGNIDSKGNKHYYNTDHPDYNRVRFSPDSGEKMFCSTDEAINAGWSLKP